MPKNNRLNEMNVFLFKNIFNGKTFSFILCFAFIVCLSVCYQNREKNGIEVGLTVIWVGEGMIYYMKKA